MALAGVSEQFVPTRAKTAPPLPERARARHKYIAIPINVKADFICDENTFHHPRSTTAPGIVRQPPAPVGKLERAGLGRRAERRISDRLPRLTSSEPATEAGNMKNAQGKGARQRHVESRV
jgi:hypothetical protein